MEHVSRLASDFGDETLDGLLARGPHPLLQRVELTQAVSTWVSSLELDEQLKGSLVRFFLKTVDHFPPVLHEDIRRPPAWLIAHLPIGLRTDDDTSRTSVLAPSIDAPE